jgi:O-antigen/teichoic acid export membrane protein
MSAGRKLIGDAAAMSAGRVLQGAAAFLALPFLARWLSPADFGLVSLAMSVVWVAIAFSDAGFGQSLVRVEPARTDVWSSVFWLTAGWSLMLTLLLVALAWPAAALTGQPELTQLIVALSVIPLIQGLVSVPMADLQRRRMFWALAGADVLTAVGGFTAAVVLAMRGAGAWALVGQQYFMLAGRGVVLLAATRFRPRLVFRRDVVREHSSFAVHTAAFGIALLLSQQADAMIIGRVLGTTLLGYYVMAYRLMTVPVYILGGSLQRVFYPRIAASQGDPEIIRNLVLAGTLGLACVSLPAMLLLSVAHAAVFEVLLSHRWLPASPVFAILAPIGALQTITALSHAVFMATGHTKDRLRVTLEFGLLWLAVLLMAAPFGIVAAASGYALAYLAYLPRFMSFYLRPTGVGQWTFYRQLAAPVLVSLAVAGGHLTLMNLCVLNPFQELMATAVELVLAYSALLIFVRRRLALLYSQIKAAL